MKRHSSAFAVLFCLGVARKADRALQVPRFSVLFSAGFHYMRKGRDEMTHRTRAFVPEHFAERRDPHRGGI